jgi:hypothetical protein
MNELADKTLDELLQEQSPILLEKPEDRANVKIAFKKWLMQEQKEYQELKDANKNSPDFIKDKLGIPIVVITELLEDVDR